MTFKSFLITMSQSDLKRKQNVNFHQILLWYDLLKKRKKKEKKIYDEHVLYITL